MVVPTKETDEGLDRKPVWVRLECRDRDDKLSPCDVDLLFFETSDLDEVDTVVAFVYGADAFDSSLFKIRLYDGDDAFEREANSTTKSFKTFNKNQIARKLRQFDEWVKL